MEVLRTLWWRLRDAWPPNRVVTALTPLLFAPAAGWIATRLAELGFEPDAGQFTAIFISGATVAVGAAWKWLDGWSKWEQTAAADEAAPVEDLHPDDYAADPALWDAETDDPEFAEDAAREEYDRLPPDAGDAA